ncbi:hypothetical protein COL41_27810 [Bacillus mycoides]|uniref:ATP-binding protein n=1 Tax=Bacillus mycoides TaxID=1405 RepID=UPI000BF30979|nr:AAA family ATPase [Bacillus mycoides]PFX90137.1 hypothetical protein COL41_27810 [Bacillus mycoides]QWH79131.1 hypothetical protein EXW59_21560 [Bacillus mycoides]QWI44179.1 hypothetical protein EXW55_14815 [Bacillus mycoides]
MEIVYIWMENFMGNLVEKQGFNFDNRFKYKVKYSEEEGFNLNIKENKNYLKDFFKPKLQYKGPEALINNINAIVGQNGVGKSSIIEFLKDSFGSGNFQRGKKSFKYLCVFREYEGTELKHHIYHSQHTVVSIDKESGIEFDYNIKESKDFPQRLEGTDIIYFSSVYDNKIEDSIKQLFNISTNYLSSHFPVSKTSNTWREGHRFKFQEIKRQVQFIYAMKNQFKQLKLPFTPPNKVELLFADLNQAAVRKAFPAKRYKYNEGSFLTSIKDIFDRTRMNGTKSDFRLNMADKQYKIIIKFVRCILEHLLKEIDYNKFKDRLCEIDFPLNQVKSDTDDDYINLVSNIKELAYILVKDGQLREFSFMLEGIASLMKEFYLHYVHNAKYDSKSKYSVKCLFNIGEFDQGDFENLLYLYEKSYINHEFIDFLWRDISSGEKAFLNIYSRFYYAANLKWIKVRPERDLIILIDEGEIYLHPHWQSKLLASLIDFFPLLFANKSELNQRNIQIILTSNSPFLVSDLPSSNIIFLKKEKNKVIVVEELEDNHQTFAANIHTLLSHSFFMEEGVTGIFAKRKINEIIDLLVNKDITTILKNEKKIEKTISLIGEPIIRHKLSQMLSDKLSIRMLSVEREIRELESRLKELERWKDDTDKAR